MSLYNLLVLIVAGVIKGEVEKATNESWTHWCLVLGVACMVEVFS